MRRVVLGAAAHALVFVCLSAVFIAAAFLEYRAIPSTGGDAPFLAALLLLAAGGLSTLTFAPVTAASSAWRNQKARSCVLIGASMAVVTALLQASFLFLPLHLILPSAIASAWPYTAGCVRFAIPGVLSGLLGVYLARCRDPRREAG